MKEQDLGQGNKIVGFDSYEEMAAFMNAREAELAEAMKHLAPQQEEIGWGCYVLRIVPVGEEETLAIFGYIYTPEEFRSLEAGAGADEDDGELDFIMTQLQALHSRGYRYGKWFSYLMPDGEYGDAHVTTLWPITEADYQHALNNGWELPMYLQTRIIDEMAEAHQDQQEPNQEGKNTDG